MEEDLSAFTTFSKFVSTMEMKHDTKGNNGTWHLVYRGVRKRRWGNGCRRSKSLESDAFSSSFIEENSSIIRQQCTRGCQWNSCEWVFVSDSSWLDGETQTQQHFLACL
ncbi:hypothetical protein CXB51_005345 [Gossypium anomalum]|uniref:Uncharacterized protein n=1 Tax=Gossypium anomalum TaxID=47600 RepID=A0A8J6D7U2_9ROSI|nr:hypothetical protein CXB51_005345 [Gossypium anomalum]